MARSIQTIYQEIIIQKNAQLPELTDNRPTAVWNRFAYVFATVTNFLEQLFDTYYVELQNFTNQAAYGSKDWLKKKAYEFQYSTITPQVISWVPANYRYEYPVVDQTLRIITQASVQVASGNQVNIKIAKGDVGSLIPLDTQEKSSCLAYFNTICPAGQFVNIISEVGDTLDLSLVIYFDGQIPSSVIQTQATDAITNYLQGLNFDGVVYAASIVDAVQNLDGIINVILVGNGGSISNYNNGFTPTPWTTYIELYSGYAGTINLTLSLQNQ
jgi:hypothetical protein